MQTHPKNPKNLKNRKNPMQYDHEANIISWEIAKGEISHAREFGNFIIHLSPAGKPILVEILEASKFIGQLDKLKIEDLENIQKTIPTS